MKKIVILFMAVVFPFYFSCKKDKKDTNKSSSAIPQVAVNITLYASDPIFAKQLNVVTGYAYLSGGSRGILVYRKSNEEFMAYDRHCPYMPTNACGIIIVKSGFDLIDTCCGSKFFITDGTVSKGPTTLPLEQYQTSFDGTKLLISN